MMQSTNSSAPPFPSASSWWQFVCGFLAYPTLVASICPSSARLQKRLAALPAIRRAGSIVELGPGLGETTRALLGGMPARARLMAIEIVPQFVSRLRTISDPRLLVVEGSADDLEVMLSRHDFPSPEVIVSGIPYAAMSRSKGLELVRGIHDALVPGGAFIAYQFRKQVRVLGAEVFGEPQVSFVAWNLPPLWIYEWTKAGSGPGRQMAVRG